MGFFVRIMAQVTAAAAAVFIVYLLAQDSPPPSSDGSETRLSNPDGSGSNFAASEFLEPSSSSAGDVTEEVSAFAAMQAAEDRLGLISALKRNYPNRHDALMKSLHQASRAGVEPAEMTRRRTAFVSNLLSQKMAFAPYAAPRDLEAYFRSNFSMLAAVKDQFGPDTCAAVLTQGNGALSAKLATLGEADAQAMLDLMGAQTNVMLDVARSGEALGRRPIDAPSGADWRRMYQKLELAGFNRSEITLFRNGALSDPARLCDATLAYYQALIDLPEETAARLRPFVVARMLGGG